MSFPALLSQWSGIIFCLLIVLRLSDICPEIVSFLSDLGKTMGIGSFWSGSQLRIIWEN